MTLTIVKFINFQCLLIKDLVNKYIRTKSEYDYNEILKLKDKVINTTNHINNETYNFSTDFRKDNGI